LGGFRFGAEKDEGVNIGGEEEGFRVLGSAEGVA
jgi:hypothetical protein